MGNIFGRHRDTFMFIFSAMTVHMLGAVRT